MLHATASCTSRLDRHKKFTNVSVATLGRLARTRRFRLEYS